MHPDFIYTPIAPAEVLQDHAGRLRLSADASGEPPAYAGTDFIVMRDGKIAAIYLFFGGAPDTTHQ